MTHSAESRGRIDLLFKVAELNGTLISVQELSKFMPDGGTPSEIAEAIANDPALSARFELKGGYLTPRTKGSASEKLQSDHVGRARARVNLAHAARFASFLSLGGFEMVAVSGSTSYGSASRSKDLDLFCIAPRGKVWASLAQSLLMARLYKLLSWSSPQICISCVMDLAYANAQFSTPQSPLFARDALEAKVLKGKETYRALMAAAGWISEFYPHAYRGDDFRAVGLSPRADPSSFDRAVDRLLFSIVRRYLRVKATALNARLRKSADVEGVFEIRLGVDHLVYESRRYVDLRSKYDNALQHRGVFKSIGS